MRRPEIEVNVQRPPLLGGAVLPRRTMVVGLIER
jgi:hypothetical protein